MADRVVCDSGFEALPHLLGTPLASPIRRVAGFLIDAALLVVPSILVAAASSALSLYIADPAGFRAVKESFALSARAQANSTGEARGDSLEMRAASIETLGNLAPLLVRIDAAGLPPSAAIAVQQSDLRRAGEILSEYNLIYGITRNANDTVSRPMTIYIDVGRFVPGWLRSATLFGIAALYFTGFTSGSRRSTLGKRLMRIQVLKLDGRPLSWWDGFERFGGYFASAGTFGIGLLDLWRDPNRRLAHDRITNTIVVRSVARMED